LVSVKELYYDARSTKSQEEQEIFLYSKTIYTSSGAHPASCPVGIVVFPWEESSQGMRPSTHLHHVLRLGWVEQYPYSYFMPLWDGRVQFYLSTELQWGHFTKACDFLDRFLPFLNMSFPFLEVNICCSLSGLPDWPSWHIQPPAVWAVTANVLLYVQASSVRDSMAEYVSALGRVTEQLETYRHPPPNVPLDTNSADIIDELERSCGIFKQKLTELARHMAWVSSKMEGFLVVIFHTNISLIRFK